MVSDSYHATKGAEMRSKHMLQSCKAATQQDSPGETYTYPSTICWDLLGVARHFPEQILHSTGVDYSCNCVYGLNSVKTWCLGVSTCATCCMCIEHIQHDPQRACANAPQKRFFLTVTGYDWIMNCWERGKETLGIPCPDA